MPNHETRSAILCALLLPVALAVADEPRPNAQPAQKAGTEESLRSKAPLPPPGFMKNCLALIESKRYDEARELLQPVLMHHPDWAKATFYLALTYHKESKYARAVELFERALALDPKYDPPRMFYGWSLYYLGRLDEARAMFESYLAVKPDYPDGIFALGLLDFDDDDIPSAQRRFEKTIRLAIEGKDPSTEAKARGGQLKVRSNEEMVRRVLVICGHEQLLV